MTKQDSMKFIPSRKNYKTLKNAYETKTNKKKKKTGKEKLKLERNEIKIVIESTVITKNRN